MPVRDVQRVGEGRERKEKESVGSMLAVCAQSIDEHRSAIVYVPVCALAECRVCICARVRLCAQAPSFRFHNNCLATKKCPDPPPRLSVRLRQLDT